MTHRLPPAASSSAWFSRIRRVLLLHHFVLLAFIASAVCSGQTPVFISLAPNAGPIEHLAGDELATHLRLLYPSTAFEVGAPAGGAQVIYLGRAEHLPARYADQVKRELAGPESYIVTSVASRQAVIAGSSPRATLFAVDALLEKLGFGFFISYSTVPTPRAGPFSFAGWELHDSPIAKQRVIFDWHNFLSSCSTWNLPDWQHWITQASRMRFNTVMVHAYGNNPMFSFSFNGQTKPVGYLANTRYGRDWGTEHVLDVRKMVGGNLFNGPVFGSEASLVPQHEMPVATQSLMQKVFQFAASRGMGVTFALDVDTESANPQNIITTLPASARFAIHGFQLADPDTPEGYGYYRAEIEQLMKLYPQIMQLAVWFRGGLNSPWRELQPEEFPIAWRAEYQASLQKDPRLRSDPDAPSIFAISKIARAFRRALDESGHSDVRMAAGSWRFDYLPAADAFMPPGVALMPLDYGYEFPSDPVQERLRIIGRHRPVVPILWAQHDDREFAGRSYKPFGGFGSMVRWSNSAGYGIIHWTTRPLDLFFKNLSDQVWNSTFNETLEQTASAMALRTFGAPAQQLGQRYLLNWIYDAPGFGRETSDRFLDQNLDLSHEQTGARQRTALLVRMTPLAHTAAEIDWIRYFQDWEQYALHVFKAQTALQNALAAEKEGKLEQARGAMSAADPEAAIDAYVRAIRHGHTSRGEAGILVTLNLRWLPYYEAQRVALGLSSLQVEFAPTHHEALAQGPGHYTFDFDAGHRPIEVLGTEELGTPVEQLRAASECASGIEVTSPVNLAIGNLAATTLPPGSYRMKLKMPVGEKVNVIMGGESQTVTFTSEIKVEATGGKVNFTLSPSDGAAQVCGLTLKLQTLR